MKRSAEYAYLRTTGDRRAVGFVALCLAATVVINGIDAQNTAAMDKTSSAAAALADAVSAYPPCPTLPEPGSPITTSDERLGETYAMPQDARCAATLHDPSGTWEAYHLEPGAAYTVGCVVLPGNGQPVKWIRLTARGLNGNALAAGYTPVEHSVAADFVEETKAPVCAMPLAEAYRFS